MDKPLAHAGPAVRAPASSQTEPASAEKRPRGRPRKTADERDDGNRRVELLNAAARLFRRKGFDGTSTRDIAAAVGMHSGSPFYHFKSKDALLYAVMDEGMRSAIARQTAALGACRTWDVESENRPQRGQFLPDLQAHSPAMGQEDGEKWTAAVDLQPTPQARQAPRAGTTGYAERPLSGPGKHGLRQHGHGGHAVVLRLQHPRRFVVRKVAPH